MLIVFIAALGYLAVLNNEPVTLKLSEQYHYEVPKIALILISSAFGGIAILILIAIRDTRRYIENWQNRKQQKKELKIQESYSKGLDAFFAGRFEESIEFFNHIFEEDPENINALLRLGDIAFAQKDLKTAKDLYMKAKEIRPQNVEVQFSLEKVFESEQKWQEAIRYLDNILEDDSGNPKALYRKRDIFEQNRNWISLMETQYKILKSDISDEDKQKEYKNLLGYKYELGRYYLERGEIDKSKKLLRNIIKVDKNFIAAYLALAESYLRENDIGEAEKLLLKGYEETSSIVFLIRLEDFFIDIGEPGRIIDIYRREARKNSKEPKLQFLLAKLYYRLEMIDYAFEAAVNIDTTALDYPDVHILLGNIYERRFQYDRATEAFKKALTRTERPLLISPFCCSSCNFSSKEWLGRCPGCKQWNTLTLDLDGACKT